MNRYFTTLLFVSRTALAVLCLTVGSVVFFPTYVFADVTATFSGAVLNIEIDPDTNDFYTFMRKQSDTDVFSSKAEYTGDSSQIIYSGSSTVQVNFSGEIVESYGDLDGQTVILLLDGVDSDNRSSLNTTYSNYTNWSQFASGPNYLQVIYVNYNSSTNVIDCIGIGSYTECIDDVDPLVPSESFVLNADQSLEGVSLDTDPYHSLILVDNFSNGNDDQSYTYIDDSVYLSSPHSYHRTATSSSGSARRLFFDLGGNATQGLIHYFVHISEMGNFSSISHQLWDETEVQINGNGFSLEENDTQAVAFPSSGLDTEILGTWNYEEWTSVFIQWEQQDGVTKFRYGFAPPFLAPVYSQYLGTATSTPRYFSITRSPSVDFHMDNITVLTNASYPVDPPLRTNSWVESFLPADYDTVNSTSSISTGADYYVDSSDVSDPGNVYVRGVWKSIKQAYNSVSQMDYSGGFEEQVTIFDEAQIFANSFDSVATGTVTINYEVYERIYKDPSWWQFWDWNDESWTERTLASDFVQFYLYEETTPEELGVIKAQFEFEQDAIINASDSTQCTINGAISIQCLSEKVDSGLDALLSAPPHGYGYYIYKKFTATTTSTSTIVMALNFPESSPANGFDLTLDVSGSIENSIQSLNEDYGVVDAYNKAMEYWNFFWYTLLIFWILKQIFGNFNFDFNYEVNQSRSTSHIRDVNMSKKHRRDIDMRH